MVDATVTALRAIPKGEAVLVGVMLGSASRSPTPRTARLAAGPCPGHAEPLWALIRDIRPAVARIPDGSHIVDMAARLLDVPYVWGGVCAYGIDCSGLVHLVRRRFSVTLSRDADDQAAATSVELGQERPADCTSCGPGAGCTMSASSPPRRMPTAPGTCCTPATPNAASWPNRSTGERAATLIAARRMAGQVWRRAHHVVAAVDERHVVVGVRLQHQLGADEREHHGELDVEVDQPGQPTSRK